MANLEVSLAGNTPVCHGVIRSECCWRLPPLPPPPCRDQRVHWHLQQKARHFAQMRANRSASLQNRRPSWCYFTDPAAWPHHECTRKAAASDVFRAAKSNWWAHSTLPHRSIWLCKKNRTYIPVNTIKIHTYIEWAEFWGQHTSEALVKGNRKNDVKM